MQCPPTRPGRKFKKFHFVPAAFNTASVSIPNRLNNTANSLINAMFTSRWVFSITFAASATLIDSARCVPAVITNRYSPSTNSAV